MKIFVESQKFEQEKYGDETVEAFSDFYLQQVSENSNVWIPAIFERNNIEDETALLQLGQ